MNGQNSTGNILSPINGTNYAAQCLGLDSALSVKKLVISIFIICTIRIIFTRLFTVIACGFAGPAMRHSIAG